LAGGVVWAQSAGESVPADDAYVRPVDARTWQPVWLSPNAPRGVNWRGVFMQSGRFLIVEHTYRLATEPGTRAGLGGPALRGWVDAASNLHGWGDGDPFYVNYVGHPMQGAVAGYIWAQNDRDYLGVSIGRNRAYWMSRLRATGYSFFYSAQFEVGPLSEASIGNIQSFRPQQGFVDHVVTPVFGLGWMLAEDTLDRYVIRPFEENVENRYARMLVRGFLNPSRSMANLLRYREPWARDDRPAAGSPLLAPYLRGHRNDASRGRPAPPLEGRFGRASIEVTAHSQPQIQAGRICPGGGGEGAFHLAGAWSLVTAIDGCRQTGLAPGWTGDVLTYQAGPRWNAAPTGRWNPYLQLLAGGLKATKDNAESTINVETRGTAVSAGAGLDLRLHRAVALRVASLDYRRAWVPALDGRDFSHGWVFSSGVVLRVGTW
jgi:hypothetical protein